jgi:fumarate reductase subunit C
MINPTEYVPRRYQPRVSTYWWLRRWAYLRFVLREISSVFVAWIVVLTLLQIRALSHGPEAYAAFTQWLRWPAMIALNGVSFAFVCYHAVTWFNLAPQAMAIRVRGKRLPGLAISAPNYAAWALLSAGVAWIVLGG